MFIIRINDLNKSNLKRKKYIYIHRAHLNFMHYLLIKLTEKNKCLLTKFIN